MTFICKAKFTGDLVHAFVTELQAMLDHFCFVISNVLLQSFAGMFFKIPSEISFGNGEIAADGRRT
jgi:hypothetical protein